MPKTLLDPRIGSSYKVDETAFQMALKTTKSRWEWLEEEHPPEQLSNEGTGYPGLPEPKKMINGDAKKDRLSRPEHQIFSLSMLGGGKVHGAAHPYGKLSVLG